MKRLLFLAMAGLAAVLQNLVHELAHLAAALFFGVPVLEFRFLTNGWGTSQVIFETPLAERTGWQWLVIALLPSALTVLLGYLIYLNRNRWLTRIPLVNLLLWYVGVFFLFVDPLYIGGLSFSLGGDVNVLTAFHLSPWIARLPALFLLLVNCRLILRWRAEARTVNAQYFNLGF